MKKTFLLFVFVVLLFTFRCTSSPGTDEATIIGEYVCTNEYIASGDSFQSAPEAIPSITFIEDGNCEVLVNYLGGIAKVFGTYNIKNDQAIVYLDLMDTLSMDYVLNDDPTTPEIGETEVVWLRDQIAFQEGDVKYMPDEYVFDIIDSNEIVIDKGFYIVNAGDSFIKTEP